jgi:hypothetical protein
MKKAFAFFLSWLFFGCGCTFTSPIEERGDGLEACTAECKDAGAKGPRAIVYERGFGYERCTCSLDGGRE